MQLDGTEISRFIIEISVEKCPIEAVGYAVEIDGRKRFDGFNHHYSHRF